MAEPNADRLFRAAIKAELANLTAAQRSALGDVKSILEEGGRLVERELASKGLSDFKAWQLPTIRSSIERVLSEVGNELAKSANENATNIHRIGTALVDTPIAAGGIRLSGVLPEVDLRQLTQIRTFMTDRLKDVPVEIGRKVRNEIALSMMGAKTPSQAIDAVGNLVEGGRGRAITIVRTETGRAFSGATQERQEQASKILPGLQKQWRRSGKIHSRITHDLADGQIVDVDKPFLVGGVRMMYPRDPSAPAKDTVNCGCVQLPYMESWDVSQPGRVPFSPEELALNPRKRDLERGLRAA